MQDCQPNIREIIDFDPENLLPESIGALRQMEETYKRWH